LPGRILPGGPIKPGRVKQYASPGVKPSVQVGAVKTLDHREYQVLNNSEFARRSELTSRA